MVSNLSDNFVNIYIKKRSELICVYAWVKKYDILCKIEDIVRVDFMKGFPF